ncbi:MAG: CCDC90 family protein [Magnetococcus sp. YQC-9]
MSNAHAIAFDALEFIEQLKTCGVPDEQAKGHVRLLTTVISRMDQQVEARIEELSAKRDRQTEDRLETLADRNELQIKGRFDGLATRQELDYKLKELEMRMVNAETTLRKDIANLENSLRQEMKQQELRMVIKLGAMFLAALGILRFWPLPVQYVPPMPAAQIINPGAVTGGK